MNPYFPHFSSDLLPAKMSRDSWCTELLNEELMESPLPRNTVTSHLNNHLSSHQGVERRKSYRIGNRPVRTVRRFDTMVILIVFNKTGTRLHCWKSTGRQPAEWDKLPSEYPAGCESSVRYFARSCCLCVSRHCTCACKLRVLSHCNTTRSCQTLWCAPRHAVAPCKIYQIEHAWVQLSS